MSDKKGQRDIGIGSHKKSNVHKGVLYWNDFQILESYDAVTKPKGTVTFKMPNKVKIIDKGAFKYVKELEEIYPSKTLEIIEDSAFENCRDLRVIYLPPSLQEVGKSAFKNCISLELTYITQLGYLKRIEDNAFYGCTSLKAIGLPNTLEHIGECAFAGCESLTSITIPNSVKYIGKDAFMNCNNLEIIHCELPRIKKMLKDLGYFHKIEKNYNYIISDTTQQNPNYTHSQATYTYQ